MRANQTVAARADSGVGGVPCRAVLGKVPADCAKPARDADESPTAAFGRQVLDQLTMRGKHGSVRIS